MMSWLRMYEKIRGVYGQVDECCEALQKYKAEGVLNGFTDKLLAYSHRWPETP